MTIDPLFLRLGPHDVVLAVERDKHQAGRLRLAAKPVHRFAGHHGESAGAECLFGHAVHPGEHLAPDYHQLFFRGVIVRGNHAPGRSFEEECGCTFVGVPVLAGNFETRWFAVENEIGAGERRNYTVRRKSVPVPAKLRPRPRAGAPTARGRELFVSFSRNAIHFFHGFLSGKAAN